MSINKFNFHTPTSLNFFVVNTNGLQNRPLAINGQIAGVKDKCCELCKLARKHNIGIVGVVETHGFDLLRRFHNIPHAVQSTRDGGRSGGTGILIFDKNIKLLEVTKGTNWVLTKVDINNSILAFMCVYLPPDKRTVEIVEEIDEAIADCGV